MFFFVKFGIIGAKAVERPKPRDLLNEGVFVLDELILDFTTTEAAILSIAAIIIYILMVVGEWRILTKAGEKGWKALIPFYNLYVSHHIVGMAHFWFVTEIIIWFLELGLDLIPGIPDTVIWALGIPIGIFTLISELVHINLLCNCFRKGVAYKLGMILVPYVFTLILAFGKAEYHHPEAAK